MDKFQPVLAVAQEPADPEVEAAILAFDDCLRRMDQAYAYMALAFEQWGLVQRGSTFATGLDLVDARDDLDAWPAVMARPADYSTTDAGEVGR